MCRVRFFHAFIIVIALLASACSQDKRNEGATTLTDAGYPVDDYGYVDPTTGYSGYSTSTTSVTCTLQIYPSSVAINTPVSIYVRSSTGETMGIQQLDPGAPWSSAAPIYGNYPGYRIGYSTAGTKLVRVIAESVSRPGVKCNSGAVVQGTVSVTNSATPYYY